MILPSLYPDNPLNFLVALGTLKVLDAIQPESEWELRWNANAEIQCNVSKEPTEKEVLDVLAEYLSKDDKLFSKEHPMKYGSILMEKENGNSDKKSEDKDTLKPYEKYEKFMEFIDEIVSDNPSDQRRLYDFAACIAYPDIKDIKASMFRFISGNNATLFGNAHKLAQEIECDKEKIHRVLFKEWDYLDNKTIMFWDPISLSREHALLISYPSGGFNPTMHAADRLAIEAISLYPILYDGKNIRTMGWNKKDFVWPIWDKFAGMDEIRGILSTDYTGFKQEKLDKIGVELFVSEKINKGHGHMGFTKGSKRS